MDNLIIRNVKQEDIPSVVDINITGWQTAYQGIIDNQYLDNLDSEREQRIVKMKNNYMSGGFIVAELDNQVVGFCRYVDNNNFSPTIVDADCELTVIYVKPNLKGCGIGSKLFEYVLNEFSKLNKNLMVLWCFKDNEPTIKFYEKMGGRIIGEKAKEHGGKENTEVCFAYNIKELMIKRTINSASR